MTLRMQTTNPNTRPKGYQRFLLRVSVITLIPLSVAGVTFLFLSLYLFLRGAPFLRLKEVEIEGNRRVPTDEILAIAEVEDKPNILSLDIKALNRRLEGHPWIEGSTIKRIFPDGIRIVIQERKPMALIHLGRLYYVDVNGEIFHEASGRERAAYPIVTGIRREDVENKERKAYMLLQKALQLLKMTQGNKILPYRSISQVHLDRAVGLLLYTTKKGTEIRLGFGDFERKLQRLSKIWPAIRSMELCFIDCTVPKRIIVGQKRSGKMSAFKQKTGQKHSQ